MFTGLETQMIFQENKLFLFIPCYQLGHWFSAFNRDQSTLKLYSRLGEFLNMKRKSMDSELNQIR